MTSLAHFEAVAGSLKLPGEAVIDGKLRASASGKTFPNVTPRNGRVLNHIAQCDVADVDAAVKSARRAFEEGQWRKSHYRDKKRVLFKLADLMRRDAEQLAVLESLDVGKPINPGGIEQQVMGALAESISLVLMAGLHLRNGLPLEGSYSQYHFGRLRHFPKDVKVIIVPGNGQATGGLGEVGLSASSGAIANAWARATGQKPRRFPLYFPVDITPFPPGKLPNPIVNPVPV